ncbi:cell division protein ZapC [Vibrio sp. SM6]|uniref:Cell division protein ZapC n=1 Tax=Vibrio agarilyticus TaxID=2726741 RepID=A0A7X8TPV0_9VIBR|nr:cell division protein ZapC [Vibrio agarilyticus]NLS12555.1 cell division protein ZapC [Vibrio agarilyticus]
MLKPSDKWTWFYDNTSSCLMLDLGDELLFRANLASRWLVDYAFQNNQFTVDDASAFQSYRERLSELPITPYRQEELALYCVAAKRFHKPVQPKSWFFEAQGYDAPHQDGDVVILKSAYQAGHFIVVEAGESASLLCYVDIEPMTLTDSKSMKFGDFIKVMHDRIAPANFGSLDLCLPMAMVG